VVRRDLRYFGGHRSGPLSRRWADCEGQFSSKPAFFLFFSLRRFRPSFLLLQVLVRLYSNVIVPVLYAMLPVYEYLCYYICFWFIVEGTRLPPETGFFISLTGLLGAIPAFMYTTYLNKSGGGNKELWTQVTLVVLLLFISSFMFFFFFLLFV
jgi:hypothetical protein